ncbi:MAG: FtsX-like permease family protein [Bacteroidota bacterium]
MIWNYLKTAIRNSKNNKLFTFINIFSLTLGITACMIIYLFIHDERSFDAFHAQKDQIYRLNEIQSFPGTNTQHVALSMPGMGPNLIKDYPEVENFTRYWNRGRNLFEREDTRITIENTIMVDSTFLDIFDYSLLEGEREGILDEPNTIVLTKETATKFFGDESPLGENLKRGENLYKVTGVLEDVPENSHLQFDALASITTVTRENPEFNNRFGSNFMVTYLVFNPNADIKALEAKMPDFLLKMMPPDEDDERTVNDAYVLYFQPLEQVHLGASHVEHDYQNYRKFNGAYLDIFALVGLFILLIASVNFMNLITARASHRWKEVGVRKAIGARKGQLFSQFTVEAMLLGVSAFVFAILLGLAVTPLVNSLIGRELSFLYFFEHSWLILLAFGVSMLLGFMAGLYPSLYLASFNTVRVLKGGEVKTNKSLFRSSLVVLQFGLAIAMVVSTLLVIQQLGFIKGKDIGFEKDHMVLVEMNGDANEVYETMKTELASSGHVLGVTASGQRLGSNFHQWGFKLKTDTVMGLTPSNVNVDFNYLDVYGIEVKNGRGFSKEYAKDKDFAFVINESFAEELNLGKSPVGVSAGHAWYNDDSLGSIIGVVEDFHFNSLHYEINTLAMVVHPEWGYSEMTVKISGQNVSEALADIEGVWNKLVPTWPFEYSFLDEHFEELYRSEQQMEAVVSMMAILAIFIACMGLFGLIVFTTERKTKEIGIRKILGASVSQIMMHLSRNFALMMLVAFVVFTPFTYLMMRQWLDNFAYRIQINPLVFLIGGILAFFIAMLTISYHTLRSARSNPADALRYE